MRHRRHPLPRPGLWLASLIGIAMALSSVLVASAPVAADSTEVFKRMRGPSNAYVFQQALYFGGRPNEADKYGLEPWITRGSTTSTRMIKNLADGAAYSYPSFAGASRTVYIIAREPWRNAVWRSIGVNGTAKKLAYGKRFRGTPIGRVGGRVIFRGTTGDLEDDDGNWEPWTTTGTGPSTIRLKDIKKGPAPSNPSVGVKRKGVLYFAADGPTGRELWKTKGTPKSTKLAVEIRPGWLSSDPKHLTVVGDRLYFVANGGGPEAYELWTSKGWPDNTRLVMNITKDDYVSTEFDHLTAVGDRLFFQADGDLWTSNGTRATTRRIDLGSVKKGSQRHFTAVGRDLYVVATTATKTTGLWKVSGTTARKLGEWTNDPKHLTALGDWLYFAAGDESGYQLWRSGGTPGTTERVTALAPTSPSPGPSGLVAFKGALYFGARDATGHAIFRHRP